MLHARKAGTKLPPRCCSICLDDDGAQNRPAQRRQLPDKSTTQKTPAPKTNCVPKGGCLCRDAIVAWCSPGVNAFFPKLPSEATNAYTPLCCSSPPYPAFPTCCSNGRQVLDFARPNKYCGLSKNFRKPRIHTYKLVYNSCYCSESETHERAKFKIEHG